MKLYGHPMSTCTRKVLTTLAEKGHEAEFVMVDIMAGAQKSPEHLARQPFGRVPALEDDGFWLYESRAIIRYLDEKLSGPRLQPGDSKERALMEQWTSVEYSYLTSPSMTIVRQMMFGKMMGKTPDMDAVEKARVEVGGVLDIADKTLARQDFFGGKVFSLADIGWMPYIQYLFTAESGDLITKRPGVNAWWERVSTRPSWKKVAG